MGFCLDLDFNTTLPEYPIYEVLIPDAIIEDTSDDNYSVCWKSNEAGVISIGPLLVSKHELAQRYPQIVDRWEMKQRHEKDQAGRTEEKFVAFASHFLDRQSDRQFTTQPQRGVACDQNLLPGMAQHWGELRSCESHPRNQSVVDVCKGCRVSHYALKSETFDRQLLMARGARVAVCSDCASNVLYGDGYENCVCDTLWTCFRWREADIRGRNLRKMFSDRRTCATSEFLPSLPAMESLYVSKLEPHALRDV
jgi:hypothetical protein